eukprot:690169-Rhodomonas_salina.2
MVAEFARKKIAEWESGWRVARVACLELKRRLCPLHLLDLRHDAPPPLLRRSPLCVLLLGVDGVALL